MADQELLAIGDLSTQTGVAVSALRYYDERGIVQPVKRVGGQRRFSRDAVGRVSFIQRAKQAGFSLDEVSAILDDENRQWVEVVDNHLTNLRDRRRELDTIIELLEEIQRCGCEAVAACPKLSTC